MAKAKKSGTQKPGGSGGGDDAVGSPATPSGQRPEQFSIPADLVEHILLGPADDRRVLQDSPLLGDVWAAFALDPGLVQDVLITPHRRVTAALVASIIPKAIKEQTQERAREVDPVPAKRDDHPPKVAYLQGLVAARLYFDQVLRILVPLTQWWQEPTVQERIATFDPQRVKKLLERRPVKDPPAITDDREIYTSLERYIALAGLIYWDGKLLRPVDKEKRPLAKLPSLTAEEAFDKYQGHIDEIIKAMVDLYTLIDRTREVLQPPKADVDLSFDMDGAGYIFQVSLNRPATAALDRSVPAVKGDAAKTLFKVDCRNIVWAVLDSGIDRTHPAFVEIDERKTGAAKYSSRIRRTFDFTRIREIVSNSVDDVKPADVEWIVKATGQKEADVIASLKAIAEDTENQRPINWARVEKLITLLPPKLKAEDMRDTGASPFEEEAPLPSPHGTHVAGIIGARESGGHAEGMCPTIRIYDFRVLNKTREDTEFAIIAALQFIRYINERHNHITVHGANLSLSIPHNVRNFACGNTPICNECERLVESGVVVVAAAGNRGFQKFQTNDGVFENYAAFSITDPGNSESVITVGSTHGNWPHTYGVSFFSSRGPTGDGRAKPDLVAPGEKVVSTVLDNKWAPESGTSMAAPHVSGAAAMLLARYDELVGRPRRVKKILCDTATDLGRERSFQGHGMLDVLRALQSI